MPTKTLSLQISANGAQAQQTLTQLQAALAQLNGAPGPAASTAGVNALAGAAQSAAGSVAAVGAAAPSIAAVGTAAQGAATNVQQVATNTGAATSAAGGLADAWRGVMGALSAGALLKFAKDAVDASMEAESAFRGLKAVAENAGIGAATAWKTAGELAKGGALTQQEAATALKNLYARGFSNTEALEMIQRISDAAANGRQSSLAWGEAIVSATEGLKNENSVLVDNSGITKNVSVMWSEYAEQIGTTAAKLTAAQKREAEYQGVMRETVAQQGATKEAMAGVQGQVVGLDKAWADLKVRMGEELMPAFSALVSAGGGVVDMLGSIVTYVQKSGAGLAYFVEQVKDAGASVLTLDQAGLTKRTAERRALLSAEFDRIDAAGSKPKVGSTATDDADKIAKANARKAAEDKAAADKAAAESAAKAAEAHAKALEVQAKAALDGYRATLGAEEAALGASREKRELTEAEYYKRKGDLAQSALDYELQLLQARADAETDGAKAAELAGEIGAMDARKRKAASETEANIAKVRNKESEVRAKATKSELADLEKMAKSSADAAEKSAQSWTQRVLGLQESASRGWFFYGDVKGGDAGQGGGQQEAQDAAATGQAMETVRAKASAATQQTRELHAATTAAMQVDVAGAYRVADGYDAIAAAIGRAVEALRAYAAAQGGGAVPAAPGGSAQYRAGGGRIFPGGPRGTDTQPVWMTPGEHVFSTQAVDYWGADLLDKMNRAPLYRAEGGLIGEVASKAGSGGAGGPGPVIRLELSDGLVASQIASPAGRRAMLDNLGKDATAARQRLGIG